MSNEAKSPNKTVLIHLAGADWNVIHPLVDEGHMPNLEALIDSGVMANLQGINPLLPPTLETTLLTGCRAFRHNILGYEELSEDGKEARMSQSTSRTVPTFWNLASDAGLKTHSIGFTATHPAEPLNGRMVSHIFAIPPTSMDGPWPVPESSVSPAEEAEALGKLRPAPQDLDPELIATFVPKFESIDQEQDKRVAQIGLTIADTLAYHNVALDTLQNAEWDVVAVNYPILARLIHGFFRYHPPVADGAPDQDAKFYNNVVTQAHIYADKLLGQLMAQIPAEANVVVCSSHGFHPAKAWPKQQPRTREEITVRHRPVGVFVAKGPLLKEDEHVNQATVLDVFPTLLFLAGLDIPSERDGRVLHEIWKAFPQDQMPAMPQPKVVITLPKKAKDESDMVRSIRVKNTWHLALTMIEGFHFTQACEILEPLLEEVPDAAPYRNALVQALMAMGDLTRAEKHAKKLAEHKQAAYVGTLLLADIYFEQEKFSEALELLKKVENPQRPDPSVYTRLGFVLTHLEQYDEAKAALEKAAQLNGESGQVRIGIGYHIFKATQNAEEAIKWMDDGLRREPQFSPGYLYISEALEQVGNFQATANVLEQILRLRPFRRKEIHERLSRVYAQIPEKKELAEKHAEAAQKL